MVKGKFVSEPLRIAPGPAGKAFDRVDVEFLDVDQSGPSFEARVFLNNPQADAETPLTEENGYAGSFHVYGYGIWPADVGKSEADRLAGAEGIRAPIKKSLTITEPVRKALSRSPTVTVTVVPVFGEPPQDAKDAFRFNDLRIVVK